MTLVGVACCFALQLSGTLHLAIVQHAICAEHGEALHVDEGASSVASGDGETGFYTNAGEESHHHCPLDEDRSRHALVVHAALVGPRAASPTAPAPPHAELARLTPHTLQLLAPKTSPPA